MRKAILKGKLIPIKRFNTKSFLLVAEKNKEIVSFVWAIFVKYGISRFEYIEELFVKKEFRNKGIETTLVKNIMKKMKKLKVATLFVTTEKENKKAMKLYRNLGFKKDKNPWFHWNPKK